MKRILILLSLCLVAFFAQAEGLKLPDQATVAKASTGLTAPVYKPTDTANYIPPRAFTLLPTLQKEVYSIIPDVEIPWYFGALIEHESCLSLTHSRCWSPTSQLLTAREQGLGLGQLTRTWNPDGSVRFDTLADMRREYRTELKDLSWDTLKDHPELQMRTMILMIRKDLQFFDAVPDPLQKYKFADSAYNGGRGDVKRARTKCSLTQGCNPDIWEDNVGAMSPKSTKPLYGNRSAKDINLHHVHDVTITRLGKYRAHLEKK
jgi:hypothetical protein